MGIKHAVAGITVVASGLVLSACDWDEFADNHFSDHETLTEPVNEVRFINDAGNVKITVGDTVEVRRQVNYGDAKPGKTYRMDGDALVLQECEVRDCTVDYEVTVPAGTTVSGRLDSGNIEVTGVARANVEAQAG